MSATTTISEQAVEKLSEGAQGTSELVAQVSSWGDTLDTYAMIGLLPMAVAILIFAEINASITESRVTRVGWLIWRIFAFMALLAGYDKIVSLLTSIGGGAGAWPDTATFIAPLEHAMDVNLKLVSRTNAYNLGQTLGPFLIWMALFVIDCVTALFAYIVVTAMQKIQAILLIIFIASGKTCLIISIVPGVGVAKSWAKVVASVAAWSFMAGIVFAATDWNKNSVNAAVGSNAAALPGHIMLWTQYVLMGIFGLAIPKLVGALASGSMGAAPGIGAALGAAMLGGKLVNSSPATAHRAAKTTVGAAKAPVKAGKWAAGKYDAAKARLGKMARGGSASGKGGVKGAPSSSEIVGGKASRKASQTPKASDGTGESEGAALNREKGEPAWHNRPEWSQSDDQWKQQGWSKAYDSEGNSMIESARPKAREGHTPHLVQSGHNAQGNPQQFRWEQVPKDKAGEKFPWRGDDWGDKAAWKHEKPTKAGGGQAPKSGDVSSSRKAEKSKHAAKRTGNTNAGVQVARGDELRVQQQKVLPRDAKRREQAQAKPSPSTSDKPGKADSSGTIKSETKLRPRRGGKQDR